MIKKLCLLLVCITIFFPVLGHADVVIVDHAIAGSPDTNVAAVTINSTTAESIFFFVSDYSAAAECNPTDNKSNTWIRKTTRTSTLSRMGTYYCEKPCTVGTSHTITCTNSGGAYNAAAAVALKNLTGPVFDKETGGTTAGATSLATGSTTPTSNEAFLLSAISFGASNTVTLGPGYTGLDQLNYATGAYFGIAVGYLQQHTLAASSPSWTWSASMDAATNLVVINGVAAAGPVGSIFESPVIN